MKSNPRHDQLRERAEKIVERLPKEEGPSSDLHSVVHNLRVHQAELELQNEQLRETQLELSLSRDQFSELFHHAPVGYVVLDQTGIMSKANATLANMLGVDSSKLHNHSLSDWVEEADRPVYLARFKAWSNDPTHKVIEARMRTKTGDVFHARLQARFDPQFGSSHLLVTVADISSTVHAQEQLTLAMNELKAILDNSLVGLVTLKNRVITQVNRRLCDMLGYAADELIGHTPEHLHVSPKHAREFGENYYWRLAETEFMEIEYPLRRKDGTIIWCQFSGRAISPPDLSLGAVWAINDITRQRQLYKDLEEAQRVWKLTFNASPDLISVVDRDFRITSANQALLDRLNMDLSNVIGQRCFEVFGRSDICPQCPHSQVLDDGIMHHGEVHFDRPPGVFRITCAPYYDEERQLTGTVHVAHDLTQIIKLHEERIEMEHKLHQAQRLESIGVLAGGVAHDFNNILQTIAGNAELALDQDPATPDYKGCLNEILSATRHASGICRQMLTFSGHHLHEKKPVFLRDLAFEMQDLLRSSIPKNVSLDIEAQGDRTCIMGDEGLLKQVLLNLTINAAEACGAAPGAVRIRIESFVCTEHLDEDAWQGEPLSPGPHVRLCVQDTGCGIDKKALPHIFDPFYSTKFTGRGLGLATVLGTVKALHGALRVDSTPGAGTTMTLLFPECPESRRSTPVNPVSSHDAQPKGRRILLIDDEAILLRTLKTGLERMGYVVTVATNGREGLACVQREDAFDTIICDMTMPEMSGDAFLRELRKEHPDLQVLLTSGYSEAEMSERAHGDKHTAFLCKPFRLHELKKLLIEMESAEDATSGGAC